MFVFRREDLPADPAFPANLEKLGYFVNHKDQIKKISAPEQDFQFKINKNPRWNEAQREAMNACIREIVLSRLHGLGLVSLHLPLLAASNEPHVPILVSSNLATASRIVVVFGDPVQDLGIWAYRTVGWEGIDAGSAVSFARAVLGQRDVVGEKAPGTKIKGNTALVLANTGQLIWHCGSRRAVTHSTWLAMSRDSAVEPPLTMTRRNKIFRNTNWQEHVDCVFDEILAARGRLVKKDAKIDIVGLAEGGLAAIRYLAGNWDSWRPYISAICLSNPLHTTQADLGPLTTDSQSDLPSYSFADFISSHCRAYVISDRPLDLPVPGFDDHGCNCYSSSEELNVEGIMPKAWESMLKWLDELHANPDSVEARLIIQEFDATEVERLADEEK